MGYRHVVGAMLAVTLFSGISSAESSARVQIEEFFRRATAILSEDTDVDRARRALYACAASALSQGIPTVSLASALFAARH